MKYSNIIILKQFGDIKPKFRHKISRFCHEGECTVDTAARIDERTLQETFHNVTPGFPFFSNTVDMHDCPGSAYPWHWHGEVEFFFGLEGRVEYHVPGRTLVIGPGDAGFINANVLHMTRAVDDSPSIQLEHLFLPGFVSGQSGSDIEMRYVRPVLQGVDLELFQFEPADPIIDLMRQTHELQTRRPEGYELRLRALVSELWLELFDQTRAHHGFGFTQNLDDERLKHMLSFISDHYAERVTLSDIAHAGLVSQRECYRIFKRGLDTTPLDCLIQRRLSAACELLQSTPMPVLDIALATGFSSSSYFGKVFREHIGKTPREYRRR